MRPYLSFGIVIILTLRAVLVGELIFTTVFIAAEYPACKLGLHTLQ